MARSTPTNPPASAALGSPRVCNEAESADLRRLGYTEARGDVLYSVAEGWWSIDPGECSDLRSNLLGFRPVYFYAETEDGYDRWFPQTNIGTRRFCINSDEHFDHEPRTIARIRGRTCATGGSAASTPSEPGAARPRRR